MIDSIVDPSPRHDHVPGERHGVRRQVGESVRGDAGVARTFTASNGETQDVSMMGSTELAYLEDERAIGFAKAYEGGSYAFVALLPNEGVTIEEYVEGLDGGALRSLMANAQSAEVEAYLPKFELEQSSSLPGLWRAWA